MNQKQLQGYKLWWVRKIGKILNRLRIDLLSEHTPRDYGAGKNDSENSYYCERNSHSKLPVIVSYI